MKWILLISLLAAQCGGSVTQVPTTKDSVVIKYIPKPVDSPYYVPRKIDSPYTVPRRVDSPYNVGVPHYIDSIVYRFIPLITDKILQKYLNAGNQTQVKFIITHQ